MIVMCKCRRPGLGMFLRAASAPRSHSQRTAAWVPSPFCGAVPPAFLPMGWTTEIARCLAGPTSPLFASCIESSLEWQSCTSAVMRYSSVVIRSPARESARKATLQMTMTREHNTDAVRSQFCFGSAGSSAWGVHVECLAVMSEGTWRVMVDLHVFQVDHSELVAQVFDDYLQQLGEDTAAYVRTVCQTIVLTVPKAIIHCQACSNPAVHRGILSLVCC